MLRFVLLVSSGFLLIASPPASAREWPESGGWTIAQVEDACGLSQTYEGDGATELTLVYQADGGVLLGVANYNWSTVERQRYDLRYVLNGVEFSGGAAVGTRSVARRGFMTRFGSEFLDHFARGALLQIFNGDALVDSLSLSGTGAAVATLRRCHAVMRAELAVAERERARLAHIPRDPFAAAGSANSTSAVQPAAARARANLASYVSNDDYPAEALRNGEEGSVGFRLDVGADGRVHDCLITGSSGSEALDAATCRIMRSRARFTPARDRNGAPTTDQVSARLRWTIAEPPKVDPIAPEATGAQ